MTSKHSPFDEASCLQPQAFVQEDSSIPIFDVRSPGEFAKGHIEGALNLPLLDNKERAQVGTLYKQEGKIAALSLGLKFATPKLSPLIEKVRSLCPLRKAKIYCARGGMRSQSVAHFLQDQHIHSQILSGGYKAFRQWILSSSYSFHKLRVIGGLTGSGKTKILYALQNLGEQTLDLEALAKHRGSAFGSLGKQPSQEQFENLLVKECSRFNPQRTIWIEDENRLIGNCVLPETLYTNMQAAPLYKIETSIQERTKLLMEDYGSFDIQEAINNSKHIKKKLGGERHQKLLQYLQKGLLLQAGEILLSYYDKSYLYHLTKRQQSIIPLQTKGLSPQQCAKKLMEVACRKAQ